MKQGSNLPCSLHKRFCIADTAIENSQGAVMGIHHFHDALRHFLAVLFQRMLIFNNDVPLSAHPAFRKEVGCILTGNVHALLNRAEKQRYAIVHPWQDHFKIAVNSGHRVAAEAHSQKHSVCCNSVQFLLQACCKLFRNVMEAGFQPDYRIIHAALFQRSTHFVFKSTARENNRLHAFALFWKYSSTSPAW